MESISAEPSMNSPQVYSYSHHQPNINQTFHPMRSDETHTSIITSLSTSCITSSRRQLALLEAISRSIHGGSPENLMQAQTHETQHCIHTNIEQCSNDNNEDNVRSILPSLQAGTSSVTHRGPPYIWAFRHFHLARLPQNRLLNFIERPIHPSFLLTHSSSTQSIAYPQLGEVPSISSSDEVALRNRQLGIWSALFMHRLEGGLLDGSLSLRMSTDGNVGPSRLSFEDILILSQSSLHHISDLHNQHEDMRIDVDNMSYEELLALEDRIGDVNTGLDEETVVQCLKHSKCFLSAEMDMPKESCSICQEEYVEEDEIGTLDCEHHFHVACIKQWLICKNVCPICKSTGLTTSDMHLPTNS